MQTVHAGEQTDYFSTVRFHSYHCNLEIVSIVETRVTSRRHEFIYLQQ